MTWAAVGISVGGAVSGVAATGATAAGIGAGAGAGLGIGAGAGLGAAGLGGAAMGMGSLKGLGGGFLKGIGASYGAPFGLGESPTTWQKAGFILGERAGSSKAPEIPSTPLPSVDTSTRVSQSAGHQGRKKKSSIQDLIEQLARR